ncbi:MAG: hypothetical protein AB7E95_08250 [Kiritimatiellales bacterium]
MKKWIMITMMAFAAAVHAETTNTYLRAADNNWNNAGNWDTAPANWTDYSANLVFGAGDGSHYWTFNNVSPANVASMTFTADAAGGYSINNNGITFAKSDSHNLIVNDSNYGVVFSSGVVVNWTSGAGTRYIRANNGDINFGSVILGTGNDTSPDLVFSAKSGRTITFRSAYTLNPGSTARAMTLQGDGTGGSFALDSTIGGSASYIHNLIVEDAAAASLNMTAGQIEKITLKSGTISYAKDNLSFGDVIFGQTSGGVANTIEFNGNDNDFGQLSITDTSGNNVLDFGDGDSVIVFDDSSSLSWASGLSIINFEDGVDSLRFGTDANGLTAAQLAQITVDGQTGASLDSNGFLVIPEPTTISLFVISSAALFLIRHNRCF